MKTALALVLMWCSVGIAADGLTERLQRGLFEEEANRNPEAAIKEYQTVVAQSDEHRKVVATALFRLGECYRKLGRTNDAAAMYRRILRDFSDQEQLTTAIRERRPEQSGQASLRTGADSRLEPALTQPEAEELARVKALARNSPDLLNARHKESLTSLQWAAQQGFPTVLEFLLSQGLDVNGPENSIPPIVLAAQRGHLRIVEMLLDLGADVNAGLHGQTALMGAVSQRFKGVVELLLARGADVRRVTSGNSTALHLAASRGDTNMVALLLARKADANVLANRSNPQNYSAPGPGIETPEFDTYNGATPLHSAVRMGSVPLVETLLRAGGEVNATNWCGTTPLHIAVALAQTNVVHILLANRADPNIRDAAGATPMAQAIAKGAFLTKALIEAGADVNGAAYQRPDFITFPLHIAAGISPPDPLRVLLATRPNLEVVNTEGHTPLWSAMQRALSTNALLLIEAGADINARLAKHSPVQSAVKQGLEAVVSALLKAGADANEQDEAGNSLLHFAVSQSPSIVQRLLEHGANPNVMTTQADTPLSLALRASGSQQVSPGGTIPSRRLIGSGGAVAPKASPRFPLSAEEARDEIVALLAKHGADEFMQRRLRISVSRAGASVPVFTRGTNMLNRFTLMEILGAVYQNGGGVFANQINFSFPDFGAIRIHRLDGNKPTVVPIDFSGAVQQGDCARDQWLEWGDVVEIPQRVFPLNTGWSSLPQDEAEVLRKCLARTVRVSVGGTNLDVTLRTFTKSPSGPNWHQPDFLFAYLPVAIRNADGVTRNLRSSSDLTRVIVRRMDPSTKQAVSMTFDTTDVAIPNAAKGNIPVQHSLWLREGDVIEIPERK
jgi:ankyrin repeat protein